MTKIIYLIPKSGYKTSLRSDTLWGLLCWGIRQVYGEERLIDFITSYQTNTGLEKHFIISSCFPFLEKEKEKQHFFPKPVVCTLKVAESEETDFQSIKKQFTKEKEARKIEWVNQTNFESLLSGKSIIYDKDKLKSVKAKVETVTHNTIDRIKGGSLLIKDPNNPRDEGSGQLFHTEEHYFNTDADEKAGLFFLAKGNIELLEGALRYICDIGLGGDNSTGKGNFEFKIKDFELTEPEDHNAFVNLSLYYPQETEIDAFPKVENPLFQYRLEDRQGKIGFFKYTNVWKDLVMMFKEGSVFPKGDESKKQYGFNPIVKRKGSPKELLFDVSQYGVAFMVKMNVNLSNTTNS